MRRARSSNIESPLFVSAIRKLRPEVFSHPVWVRFGNKAEAIPAEELGELFAEADSLVQTHPADACQVLLLCAVFQHYAGQSTNALTTLGAAQELAERTGFEPGILWSLWGACAICTQQGRREQAAAYLTSLKGLLTDQHDWILANFVDVVRQTLLQQGIARDSRQLAVQGRQPLEELLAHTFRWLNEWGFSVQAFSQGWDRPDQIRQSRKNAHPFPSFQKWRGSWRSLKLMFRGELKVNWLDIRSQSGRKQPTLWGFILSLLHLEAKPRQNENWVDEPYVETPESTLTTPQEIHAPATNPAPEITIDTRMDFPGDFHLPPEEVSVVVSVSVHMLGNFNLTIQETPLNLPTSRSLSLLKYLLFNHKQNTPREILMDIFWPEASKERARNNLNVAINGIRTALRTVTDTAVIVYKDNTYGIAPELQFWLDVEEFERLVESGRRLESRSKLTSAVSEYEAAISLYQGDFLEENPYDNWTVLPRERLRLAYLETLDRLSRINFNQKNYAMCITLSQMILTRDRCREDAHCMLMRCYNRQGQDHLALRQYQACVDALRLELDVTPAPETTRLYQQIRRHQRS